MRMNDHKGERTEKGRKPPKKTLVEVRNPVRVGLITVSQSQKNIKLTCKQLQQCFGNPCVYLRARVRVGGMGAAECGEVLEPADERRTCGQTLQQCIQEACVSQVQQPRDHA